jgi:hypothetical protein
MTDKTVLALSYILYIMAFVLMQVCSPVDQIYFKIQNF